MSKQIGKFELIDHGMEHSQYFQGCGVSFTSFNNVVTGIGDDPAEAIDNCLEQIAQDGFDTEGMEYCLEQIPQDGFGTEGMESRIMKQEGWSTLPTEPSVTEEYPDQTEECELHYHVSIRWNEITSAPKENSSAT